MLTTITAVGTADRPVIFSAKEPADPDNQRWKGLKFQNALPDSMLKHCIIEFSDDSGLTLLDTVFPIEDCVIRSNGTEGQGGWQDGGGIHGEISGSTLTLERVIVTQNTADRSSGGIYALLDSGAKLELLDSTVSENVVNPAELLGNFWAGGIYVEDGDIELIDSLVSGNLVKSKCASAFCTVLVWREDLLARRRRDAPQHDDSRQHCASNRRELGRVRAERRPRRGNLLERKVEPSTLRTRQSPETRRKGSGPTPRRPSRTRSSTSTTRCSARHRSGERAP